MKSIGKIIQEARQRKKLTIREVERITKIKSSFLKALESERWEKLPEFPVTSGFVKNIASVVGYKPERLIAILRRDYPPKSLNINPKPDVENKLKWSPRLTFLLGVIAAFLLLISYLVYQYLNFINPPPLEIFEPEDNAVVSGDTLRVAGRTDPESTLTINNQPVMVDAEGNFSVEIEIYEGTGEVKVIAKSRSGKMTEIKRKISPELKDNSD